MKPQKSTIPPNPTLINKAAAFFARLVFGRNLPEASVNANYTQTRDLVFERSSTEELYVAAAMKEGTVGKGLSNWVQPNPIRLMAISIKKIQQAIAIATKYDEPNFLPLYDLYERALFDDVVIGTMETRIFRVAQSKFRFVDPKTKKENEDLTKAFQSKWFYDFLIAVMEQRFFGHSLIEVTQVNADGIVSVETINRRHVKAYKKIIVKEESDTKGEQYDAPGIVNYYFEIGNHRTLGILVKILPLVALSSMGVNAWAIFVEKLGQPPRVLTTDSTDKKRLDQLNDALREFGTDMYMLLQGNEQLTLPATTGKTDAANNYDAFLNRCDNSKSRIILGNDATISSKDTTGTYGGIKAMAELQEYRHMDDKTFTAHVVNSFLEKFSMFGYKTSGFVFEWDEFEEMDTTAMIDAIPKIAPHAELDWKMIAEKTGIPILGPKSQGTPGADPLKK